MPKMKDVFFGWRFSVALLNSSADFVTEMNFGREKPEHANAPINTELLVFSIDVLAYSLRVKKISWRCIQDL